MTRPALILFTLLLTTPAFAQGTQADYDRANSLAQRTRDKVFRASVEPHWIGQTSRFWYRNDLQEGKREFILVDPAKKTRLPAFDHPKLAASLSKVLGREVTADKLPVDNIAFAPVVPRMTIYVQSKGWEVDPETYELKPADWRVSNPLRPLSSDRRAAVSLNGGEETRITFVNHLSKDVTLFWIPSEGDPVSYGVLKPGESREQHSYVKHVWLVTHMDGTPLGRYEAEARPGTVLVGIPVPHIYPARPLQAVDVKKAPARNDRWEARVRDYNVVLYDTMTQQQTVLTTDGSAADRYEGRPTWSPDGTKFVLMKTVPAQEHKVYLVDSSPRDQVQPKLRTLDYLKPGDQIAQPKPHLFDATTGKEIPVKDTLFPAPWSITNLEWEPDGRRFTFLYNQRGHQVMRLVAVDAATGEATAVIDEQAKTFIDWNHKTFLHRLPATKEALWQSERDGWNHLYLYDTATGSVKNQVTKGNWVVRGVDRVDPEKRQIWFRAGAIIPGQDPYYIHYGRVNFDGSGLTLLTEGDGTHRVTFSPDGSYLVDTYSRVDLPPITEVRSAETGKKVLELERADASALLATGWKYPERFVAKARDGVTDIYGVILRPTNFDPKKKYPVIESIYAGPQGSFVVKPFARMPGMEALAELGFIVVQMDGMGTSNRSKAFHDVCWKNLAEAGFPDRIAWIKAAAAKYPSMDLTRVGLYGGSAGGQNALGGLLLHGDFYKAGVADCGCHDNRMDKIWWNEQWMGWPIGPHYAEQSNVTLAPRLTGKLLLMVGELDTNVDPASTMQVVNALIKANKEFDFLMVPGSGHGTTGSPYGRRKQQDFFVRNLLGVEPPNRNAATVTPRGAGARQN
jgi:dipeptidyl-peptidase 4